MMVVSPLIAAPVALALLAVAILLAVWWRQQTFRWALVVALCLLLAPLLSWWSGSAFRVEPYRAGCDALCIGRAGAPIATARIDGEGETFLPLGFAVNSLLYLALLLAWSAVVRSIAIRAGEVSRHAFLIQAALVVVLVAVPLALAPLFLPVPHAQARGDPLRIAINAQRELYMYDQDAASPVLRVGLEDVRPRADGEQGMRVCLRAYTFFYLPAGYLYLDMTPEGVHSNTGGALPNGASCWP
jgi:hypothetical protein